jgi:hypothetical protein
MNYLMMNQMMRLRMKKRKKMMMNLIENETKKLNLMMN